MTAIDFGAFIDELATVSGDAIKPFFRTSLGVEDKSCGGTFDPVTAADRVAEQAMRTLIREKFPAHGIVGEGGHNGGTPAEAAPQTTGDVVFTTAFPYSKGACRPNTTFAGV